MAIKVKKLLYIIAAFKEHLIDTWLLAKKVGGGGVLLAKNVEKMLNFIVLFWEKIVEQMHNFIVVFWGKNRLRGRERVLSICDTFWAQSHDLLSAKKSEKIIDIICAFYDIGGEGTGLLSMRWSRNEPADCLLGSKRHFLWSKSLDFYLNQQNDDVIFQNSNTTDDFSFYGRFFFFPTPENEHPLQCSIALCFEIIFFCINFMIYWDRFIKKWW